MCTARIDVQPELSWQELRWQEAASSRQPLEGASMLFPLLRQSAGVTKNSKSQISNNKQITMTKIQNSKHVYELEEPIN
jgi:hypothetical protein